MGSLPQAAPAMLRSSYGTHVLRPTTKERGPGRVVALNALGLLAVFGVAAWTGGASPSRAALLATRAKREPQQRTVTVTAMDLVRQFPKVREALADMGDRGCVTQMYDYEACVEQYLPSSMVFTFDAAALEGDLGEGATGWLATCFNQYTLDTSTASLLVVFSPTGTIRAATIVPSSLPYDSQGDEIDDLLRVTVDGMRYYSPDAFLLMSNSGRIKAGNPYLWEWKTETAPYVVPDETTNLLIDSHASSLVYDAPSGTSKFYALQDLNENSTGLARYDTKTGAMDLVRFNVYALPNYPNHIQYLQQDAVVLTGNKAADPEVCSFFLMDQKTLETQWCVGGRATDFAMYDIDGSRADTEARNYSFWHVNHGLEYFGEGDYFVFANSRNATDLRSRVAVVNLDMDAMVARVVWDYQVPYAFVYGDADRMPTGDARRRATGVFFRANVARRCEEIRPRRTW